MSRSAPGKLIVFAWTQRWRGIHSAGNPKWNFGKEWKGRSRIGKNNCVRPSRTRRVARLGTSLLQQVHAAEGNLILLSSVSADQDCGVSRGDAFVDVRRSSMHIVAVVFRISGNILLQPFSAATCTVYSGYGVRLFGTHSLPLLRQGTDLAVSLILSLESCQLILTPAQEPYFGKFMRRKRDWKRDFTFRVGAVLGGQVKVTLSLEQRTRSNISSHSNALTSPCDAFPSCFPSSFASAPSTLFPRAQASASQPYRCGSRTHVDFASSALWCKLTGGVNVWSAPTSSS